MGGAPSWADYMRELEEEEARNPKPVEPAPVKRAAVKRSTAKASTAAAAPAELTEEQLEKKKKREEEEKRRRAEMKAKMAAGRAAKPESSDGPADEVHAAPTPVAAPVVEEPVVSPAAPAVLEPVAAAPVVVETPKTPVESVPATPPPTPLESSSSFETTPIVSPTPILAQVPIEAPSVPAATASIFDDEPLFSSPKVATPPVAAPAPASPSPISHSQPEPVDDSPLTFSSPSPVIGANTTASVSSASSATHHEPQIESLSASVAPLKIADEPIEAAPLTPAPAPATPDIFGDLPSSASSNVLPPFASAAAPTPAEPLTPTTGLHQFSTPPPTVVSPTPVVAAVAAAALASSPVPISPAPVPPVVSNPSPAPLVIAQPVPHIPGTPDRGLSPVTFANPSIAASQSPVHHQYQQQPQHHQQQTHYQQDSSQHSAYQPSANAYSVPASPAVRAPAPQASASSPAPINLSGMSVAGNSSSYPVSYGNERTTPRGGSDFLMSSGSNEDLFHGGGSSGSSASYGQHRPSVFDSQSQYGASSAAGSRYGENEMDRIRSDLIAQFRGVLGNYEHNMAHVIERQTRKKSDAMMEQTEHLKRQNAELEMQLKSLRAQHDQTVSHSSAVAKELSVLRARVQLTDSKVATLNEQLQLKTHENAKLAQLCDELIASLESAQPQ